MKSVTVQELQRETGRVGEMARGEPVAIEDGLVLLSMEEFQRLKRRDRRALLVEELPEEIIEQVAKTGATFCILFDRLR